MRIRNTKGIGCVDAVVILVIAIIVFLVFRNDIICGISWLFEFYTEGGGL